MYDHRAKALPNIKSPSQTRAISEESKGSTVGMVAYNQTQALKGNLNSMSKTVTSSTNRTQLSPQSATYEVSDTTPNTKSKKPHPSC